MSNEKAPQTGPPGPMPQGGPEIGPGFSLDRRWWWNGAGWVPATPPQPQYVKIAPPSLGEQAAKAVPVVVLGGLALLIVVVALAAISGR